MPNPEGKKGDKRVLDALKKAANQSMTPEERHQQKVSFIVGTMGGDSSISREEVQKILEKQNG